MHNLEEYMQRMLTSGRLSHLLARKTFRSLFCFSFSLIYLDNCHVLLNVLFFLKFLNELRVIVILKALNFCLHGRV